MLTAPIIPAIETPTATVIQLPGTQIRESTPAEIYGRFHENTYKAAEVAYMWFGVGILFFNPHLVAVNAIWNPWQPKSHSPQEQ